jgi:VanZ family protein|tara:strand:- start:584 stop:934 length:351 start_codon:yes stop_codon:yes gene_type:complete
MQLVFYRSFFVVTIILVYLLAITPSSGNTPQIPFLDKILHFFIFFVLTFILDFCTRKPLKDHFYLISLLISFGIFIEVSQYFTATRSAEFLDWVADSLGVLVYLFLAPNISIGLKR